MPSKSYIVTTPPRQWGHAIKEFTLGFVRERQKLGLHLDEEKAKLYFADRSRQDNYTDFTDSRRDWYSNILSKSVALQEIFKSKNPVSILDLGCGTGGVLVALLRVFGSKNQFSYLGVEQDRLLVEKCKEQFVDYQFLQGDLGELRRLNLEIIFRQPDIIIASNVFPYINSPIPILAFCRQQIALAGRTKLVLIEPHPCSYWESEFGGFGIKLRTEAQWSEMASKAGWLEHEETTRLYLCSIMSRPLLKMANLLIFK